MSRLRIVHASFVEDGQRVEYFHGDEVAAEDESRPELADALEQDTGQEPEPGLLELSREDLNVRAVGVGVEHPERLPNKTSVVEAIHAAEQDGQQ